MSSGRQLFNVIQSEAKDLGNILYVIEILPPFGRLNDKWFNFKI